MDSFRFMVIIFRKWDFSVMYFSLFSFFQFLLGFVIISEIACFKPTHSNRLSFLGRWIKRWQSLYGHCMVTWSLKIRKKTTCWIFFQFRKNANWTNHNTFFDLFDCLKSIPDPHYTRVKLSSWYDLWLLS